MPLSDQPNLFPTKSRPASTLGKNSFSQSARIVFALCDAIGNKNESLALTNYNLFLQNRADHFYLLSMLGRQLRLLVLAQKKALTHEKTYTQEKMIPQAKLWTLLELKNAYERMVSLEESAKSGEVDLEIGFLPFLKSLF
ncbi:MAG: hypothetical protein UV05_C0025G0010 [candidate division CPR1 bacterium GW2011_GWA2_42_17]|uniref:DNA polymerase III delta subunit-like C-terminal domain-containing protein n=1 Tax=candidate division CPR1 bacterium GW2011_GWA2_42_17 TaxID=1618341 RepID=A0A0G1C207_9BACT|nr:MAG: hypothetical protein UV05_C0025G0010 [candidate division CPR1 bacterium GW2011_GWA2_42_17]